MNITDQFNEKGVLFLKSVFTQEKIEELNKDVREFMNTNKIFEHIKKRHDVSEEYFFVNNTYTSLDNYKKMQYYYIPVIDNRGSHNRANDIGMIDIYNVHTLLPNIYTLFDIELILSLLFKITGKKWKLLRNNIQICTNVSNPVSFHFENTEQCLKFVIYLSDITEESGGAPMYIEKTHNIKNNIKNDDIKTYYGVKGDVLISYQNGLHKKMTQKNSTIGFLVFNFIL
jgi:hypothetical protein